MPTVGIRVEGLREMERLFKLSERGMEKGIREALEAGSESVRVDAQSLAVVSIPNIGIPWSRMRIGVRSTTSYVAPLERGRGSNPRRRRPNLKQLLLGRAMEPALERNRDKVRRDFQQALADLHRLWRRA